MGHLGHSAGRVSFVLSNAGHHLAMFLPVARQIRKMGAYDARFISLSEMRGIPSPKEEAAASGIPLVQVLTHCVRRSSSSGRQTGKATSRWARRLIRDGFWRLVLKRAFLRASGPDRDLIVVPNDSAYPYDRIVDEVRRRNLPFVLVQEGIRFRVPAGEAFDAYGKGGANAVVAWGESSARFFQRQGVPADRILSLGNPRLDGVSREAFRQRGLELRHREELEGRVLVLLSNPIDDQGFCTTDEKILLLERFIHEASGILEEMDATLVVKLHGREAEAPIQEIASRKANQGRIRISSTLPLYPLLAVADAAVVLASSAGLEAMLLGVPVGVLEIPGHGFAFDYVQGGAASGLRLADPLGPQVTRLLAGGSSRQSAVAAYLKDALATRDDAALAISQALGKMLDETHG